MNNTNIKRDGRKKSAPDGTRTRNQAANAQTPALRADALTIELRRLRVLRRQERIYNQPSLTVTIFVLWTTNGNCILNASQ